MIDRERHDGISSGSRHPEEQVFIFSINGGVVWLNKGAQWFSSILLKGRALRTFDDLARHLETTPGQPNLRSGFDAASRAEPGMSGEVNLIPELNLRMRMRWRLELAGGSEGPPLLVLSLSKICENWNDSDASYRETFDHALEGFFRTTLDGHYLRANLALAKMYGYESPARLVEALQDLNTQLYVNDGRRGEFVRLMQEQGFVIDFQSEVRRSDGRHIWIAEFARTVLDGDGNPRFYEGSVIDITANKQAERALRESEGKFRLLAETTSAVPWESSLGSDKFDYVGPQALALLGFPVEEWLKPGFWQMHVHADDAVWVPIVRDEAVSKGRPFEMEYRMIHADGRIVWIRDIIGFANSAHDKATLGGFLLNVTHRRKAEDSLRENRLLLEQIASASPVILYAFDLVERECIFVDGRVKDILGYEKEAVVEMSPLFLITQIHPDETEASEAHLERLARAPDGDVVMRKFRIRKADGGWVWLCSREVVFKRRPSGEPRQIVGTAEDITEQVEATEALIANEELFRRLVETTKVIPFEIDPNSGRFTYVGPRAAELLGYNLHDWYGEGFWRNLIHPEDQGKSFPKGNLAMPSEQDFQADFRVRASNGAYIWVRQILHCGREQNLRSVAGGFLLDITEGKELERQNEEAKRQLRALAERNQTIREEERINAAHEIHDELGQALTIMKIDLAWMTSRLTATHPAFPAQPLLDKIRSMETLADATLGTVRRITAALRPPVLDELGLSDAIEWQAAEFGKRVGLRCEVKSHAADPIPPEVATVVFRIFQEILTNVARHANATAVRISLFCDHQEIDLVVSDNGCGISPEKRSRSPSFGLLGMSERAMAVGGHVEIQGNPGKGTIVSVKIPIQRSTPKDGSQADR